MNAIIKNLEALGCDVKGALARVGDDEDFYVECLHDIIDDPYFAILKKALDEGDLPAAFDAAHTLKGVLANVGLTPMYDKIVEIVEPLRAKNGEDLSAKYEQLMEMKQRLERMLLQK